MIRIQVDHRAVKHITKQLMSLEPKLRKRALTRAAKEAMRPMHRAARAAAPVDPEDGGQYRRSIRLRNMKRSRSRVGVSVVSNEKWLAGEEGEGFYPAQVEFGWRAGETDVPGQHTLEEVFKQKAEEVKRKFIEQVPKEVDKIIGG